MEIEVGEFVRTKSNGIKKVDIIFENKTVNRYGYETGSDWDGKWYSYIKTTDIVKHSKQLIDLIEEGDYVNGERVENILQVSHKHNSIIVNDEEEITEEEIKTILTHEQYEKNCYRLEE